MIAQGGTTLRRKVLHSPAVLPPVRRPPLLLRPVQAVDDYVTVPDRAVDKPFQMPIEDVFSIAGRGTVVTGRVEQGGCGGRGRGWGQHGNRRVGIAQP